MRILFPDARFEGEPDLERAMAGPDIELDIRDASSAEEIPAGDWAAADAILVYNTMYLTPAVAELARACRIVVRVGVGYDKIDVAAFGRRGIPVSNTPDYGTMEVADHAIALMLSLCRGIVSYDEALRQDPVGNWEFRIAPAVRRLRGATFGVVGLGRIGTAAALRARGFGMAVVFYDPYLPSGAELALDIGRARSLHELLGRSDVVSLHAPLTDETRGMINQDAFAAMRPGAVLINTARGPICELPPLAAALRSGRLAGAGLDVLPDEPPDPADPLIQAWRSGEPWAKGRLLITPHAAFFSAAAFEDMRRKSLETAMLYLREGRLQNCVNRRWLQQRDTV